MTTKKWIAMFYAIYIYFTKKLIQMTAVSVAESELAVSVAESVFFSTQHLLLFLFLGGTYFF